MFKSPKELANWLHENVYTVIGEYPLDPDNDYMFYNNPAAAYGSIDPFNDDFFDKPIAWKSLWPQSNLLDTLLDILLCASLQTEEGNFLKFSIVYVPDDFIGELKDGSENALLYKFKSRDGQRINFSVSNLAKISSATKTGSSHIIVTNEGESLIIYGVATEPLIPLEHGLLKFAVLGPCSLVIELGFEAIVKFMGGEIATTTSVPNFTEYFQFTKSQIYPLSWASLCGQDNNLSYFLSLWDGRKSPAIPHCLRAIQRNLSSEEKDIDQRFLNLEVAAALSEVARLMSLTKRGGILAIESNSDNAQKLQCEYTAFPITPPLDFGNAIKATAKSKIAKKAELRSGYLSEESQWKEKAIQIGRMSSVDGAVLFSPKLEVLGFGFKISEENQELPMVKQPSFSSTKFPDLEWSEFAIKKKGTRHQNAVRFANNNRDRLVIISSADGPTAFIFFYNDFVAYWPIKFPEAWNFQHFEKIHSRSLH